MIDEDEDSIKHMRGRKVHHFSPEIYVRRLGEIHPLESFAFVEKEGLTREECTIFLEESLLAWSAHIDLYHYFYSSWENDDEGQEECLTIERNVNGQLVSNRYYYLLNDNCLRLYGQCLVDAVSFLNKLDCVQGELTEDDLIWSFFALHRHKKSRKAFQSWWVPKVGVVTFMLKQEGGCKVKVYEQQLSRKIGDELEGDDFDGLRNNHDNVKEKLVNGAIHKISVGSALVHDYELRSVFVGSQEPVIEYIEQVVLVFVF